MVTKLINLEMILGQMLVFLDTINTNEEKFNRVFLITRIQSISLQIRSRARFKAAIITEICQIRLSTIN